MFRLTLLGLISLFIAYPLTAIAETVTVNIQGFAFNPKTISLNEGDSVTWNNQDGAAHSTTQDANLWSCLLYTSQ